MSWKRSPGITWGIKIWLGGSHKISADRMQSRDGMDEVKALEVSKKRYEEIKYSTKISTDLTLEKNPYLT